MFNRDGSREPGMAAQVVLLSLFTLGVVLMVRLCLQWPTGCAGLLLVCAVWALRRRRARRRVLAARREAWLRSYVAESLTDANIRWAVTVWSRRNR